MSLEEAVIVAVESTPRDREMLAPRCESSEAAPIIALLLESPFTKGVYGRGVDALEKDDTWSKMTNSSVAFVSLTMLARKAVDRGCESTCDFTSVERWTTS
jgi:hypothetical protein